MNPPVERPDDVQTAQLARLIKRSTNGRGWCSTSPLMVARYLLSQGVTLPPVEVKPR